MACFSLGFIENILIWLVIIGAIIALIKLVIPLVAGAFGAASIIVQALNIVVWAIIAIFIIVLIFDLIACLLGLGSMRPR